ncbi:hypothetical protein KQH40_01530 [bacterium]|nr:hypothetical protein [bacterium]
MQFESFLLAILRALGQADIDYMLGGALAVWAYGEPRTTQDIDIVVALPIEKAIALSKELEKIDIYLPSDIILDGLLETKADIPLNAIHGTSGFKAEFFLLKEEDELRNSAFKRRRQVDFSSQIGAVYIHAPEDLIIYKLLYYSLSQQTKHIRDIGSILKVSGEMIDYDYITRWTDTKGLSTLWQEIQENI